MLTPHQQRAVDLDAPVVVCTAGAGAGKTRVLTERVVRLRRQGVYASDILVVTFTRAAATEMRERLAAALDPREMEGLEVSTIHAWCGGLLRRHPYSVGRTPEFSIYDQTDVEDVQRGILTDLGIRQASWEGATDGRRLNTEKDRRERAEQAARLRLELEQRLTGWNALSFSGLLTGAQRALSGDERIRQAMHREHVLVEEAQDTAPMPWQLFRLLTPRCLFVVGDQRQGIYSFQGANLADLEALRAGGESIVLPDNFRSTPEIVDVANLVAAGMGFDLPGMVATRPHGRPVGVHALPDRDARGLAVADAIENQLIADPAASIAVLAREWRSLEPAAAVLARFGIPATLQRGREDAWTTGGMRAVRYILRAAVNLRDGHSAEQAIGEVRAPADVSRIKVSALRRGVPLTEADDDMARLFAGLREHERDVGAAASAIVHGWELPDRYVATGRETKAVEVALARETIAAWCEAGGYEGDCSVIGLLDWLTHRDLSERAPKVSAGVNLGTVHWSKGLEFNHVHLLDWRPRGDADEERRVWYVGATRARDTLDAYRYGEASRVMGEVEAFVAGEHAR